MLKTTAKDIIERFHNASDHSASSSTIAEVFDLAGEVLLKKIKVSEDGSVDIGDASFDLIETTLGSFVILHDVTATGNFVKRENRHISTRNGTITVDDFIECDGEVVGLRKPSELERIFSEKLQASA